MLIAEATLVWAAWVRLWKEESQGYGFVDDATPELSMAIEKDFRGLGYGLQLLEKIIRRVTELGYDQISLSVDKRNKAFNLYQKVGFITVRETDGSCVMVRRIR